MKTRTVVTFCMIVLIFRSAEAQSQEQFTLHRHSDMISFITMDSTHSAQTTVIEYPEFLVLSELPFSDQGADKSTDLSEDIPRADRFIQFINREFGNRPVKFVISSHWHLHSLSAITPFFDNGTRLITTKNNWAYSVTHGFLGTVSAEKYASQIVEIGTDTTILAETNFPIRVLYIDTTYKNKPTDDYLFLYFPANKTIHASCMCPLPQVDLAVKKNIIFSDRLSDLHEAISRRNLPIDTIIRLGRSEPVTGTYLPPVFTRSYFDDYMNHGISMHTAARQFTEMDRERISRRQHEILSDAMRNNTPASVINQAVYNCIRTKDFDKAVALARILVLYSPGELNYIDTMGEAYFMAGDSTAAFYYDGLLKKKDPKFGGGLKSWEENRKK
jgi:hypothetical protein